MDLARDIVAFLAEPFEPGLLPVHVMQRRKRRDLRVINRAALGRRGVGQGCVPQDAAFHHVHDIEHRAGDALILTEAVRLRDGEAERMERRNDAILAIHRVR